MAVSAPISLYIRHVSGQIGFMAARRILDR